MIPPSISELGVADVLSYRKKEELEPYITLVKTGSVQTIMAAHMINQNEKDLFPVTFSKK